MARASTVVAFVLVAGAMACGVLTPGEGEPATGSSPVLPDGAPTDGASSGSGEGGASSGSSGSSGHVEDGSIASCPKRCFGTPVDASTFDTIPWSPVATLTLDSTSFVSPPTSLLATAVVDQEIYISKTLPAVPPHLCIELCARIDQTGDFVDDGEIDLVQTMVNSNGAPVATALISAGLVDAWTGPERPPIATNLPRGRWFHLRLELGYVAGTAAVYVDDVAKYEGTMDVYTGDSTQIMIGASSRGAIPSSFAFHVDDLVITKTP